MTVLRELILKSPNSFILLLSGGGVVPPPCIMGIRELIRKYTKIQENIKNIPAVINGIVARDKDILLSLNRDQMLLGRNAEGEVLTPSYLNDPYFKSNLQAEVYARMKYKLEQEHKARIENPTLYPDKDKDTPNLIVTGPFQDNMFILPEGESFIIGSSYRDSNDIENKYNNLVFGISPESKGYFYKNFIHPALLKLLQ